MNVYKMGVMLNSRIPRICGKKFMPLCITKHKKGGIIIKTKNLGKPYKTTISVRLNEEQANYLTTVSNLLGIRSSDYLRMLLNSNMVRLQEDENEQTDLNDQL